MRPLDRQFAESIDGVSRALAEWTVSRLSERVPGFIERYGDSAWPLWKGEIVNRLQYLSEAVAADRPALFAHSVEWARAAFLAREMDLNDLHESLLALDETVQAELPAQIAARASKVISAGIDVACRPAPASLAIGIESSLEHAGADTPRARLYLNHLLERHQSRAVDVLLEAVKSGRTVAEVYEAVITPALAEVGRMWHLNEATVADEHYVTAATQVAMAALRGRLPRAEPNGMRVLASGVGGDLHDVGIRMVADLLESDGWQVECLGANMPTADLVDYLADKDGSVPFQLVALSASTGLAVRTVAGAVDAIRAATPELKLPIMVGGGPFAAIPDLWQVVGADGCATSASEAVRVARRLASARVH